jgi:hypothetical protein
MTSLDFLNRASVALPLISLTILDLKMWTSLNLAESYFSNLKIFLVIRLLIFCLSDTWNRASEVVIQPSFQNCFISSKSLFSLAVIKTIDNSTLLSIAVINCSSRSACCQQFCNPFRWSLPQYGCSISASEPCWLTVFSWAFSRIESYWSMSFL